MWGESRCLELLILSVNLQRPVPSEAFYILPRDAIIHPIWKMSTGKQSTISPEERKWMKLIITAPLTFNELLHFEDKASLKLSFPGGRFPLTWMSMSRILPHTATGSKKKVYQTLDCLLGEFQNHSVFSELKVWSPITPWFIVCYVPGCTYQQASPCNCSWWGIMLNTEHSHMLTVWMLNALVITAGADPYFKFNPAVTKSQIQALLCYCALYAGCVTCT